MVPKEEAAKYLHGKVDEFVAQAEFDYETKEDWEEEFKEWLWGTSHG